MVDAAGVEVEVFTEAEHEVAAILCDLADLVRARSPRRGRRRGRGEIPTWGCRRPRTVPPPPPPPPAEKPAGVVREAAASPDTPLVFHPDESSGGDDGDDAVAAAKKAPASHAEWVQEQRAVVASLSQENSQLSKQIEEYRIRLQSSRCTNDDLKLMQCKLKRQREQAEEEEEMRRKLQATTAAIHRPAPVLGLDLNEPARAPEEEEDDEAAAAKAAAEWYHLGQQRAAMACKAAMAAQARHRRREIRRAKAAASRIRRAAS
ncbi:uncharacterized protein LOC121053595 [Oryza brachyantha]|uniref:uncharacterized protein LOC121053595 n=1 Tax=Oryza brachyantha TaxID=4533 RepID=UPI001ADC2C9C|nr:uncharacterized protein LOC121053595 [Oryza brachyantha]